MSLYDGLFLLFPINLTVPLHAEYHLNFATIVTIFCCHHKQKAFTLCYITWIIKCFLCSLSYLYRLSISTCIWPFLNSTHIDHLLKLLKANKLVPKHS